MNILDISNAEGKLYSGEGISMGSPKKVKSLSDAKLEELVKSERPDGLVILSPEDVEAVAHTIKHLRAEISKLKGKSSAGRNKS